MNMEKKQISLYLILALSAIAVLIAFYYEGLATARFGSKFDEHLDSFKNALKYGVDTRVEAISPQVGVWNADPSNDQTEIENKLIKQVAGAEGVLGRQYNSTSNDPSIHVNITCGYSRSVGAHTPDVCFTGSGSKQETKVERISFTYKVTVPNPDDPKQNVEKERKATFKTAIFSDVTTQYRQRVFWGWKGVETDWIAPMFPRLRWNGNEPICKMYVSIPEGSVQGNQTVDTVRTAEKFLTAFLPKLDQVLTGTYEPDPINTQEEIDTAYLKVLPPPEKAPVKDKEEDDYDLSSLTPAIEETPEKTESKPEEKPDVKSEAAKPEKATKPADNSANEDEFSL